jgi:hypothetical protein
MATTTTATTTTPTGTVTAVTQSWIKAHEKIVALALVLLVGGWGYGKYADASASKAEARASVAEATLAAQKTQDTQLAATVTQLTQQYQQLTSTLAAQNTTFALALAQRQAAVVQNQSNDATLGLPALANRLQTLGNAPTGSVTTQGDSVNLTHPGALAITDTLETIPALNADLTDTKAVLGATQAAKAAGDKVIDAQIAEIAGLNLAATDADKACKAQVATVKAEGRRNSLKWFLRGAIVGYIGGLLSH